MHSNQSMLARSLSDLMSIVLHSLKAIALSFSRTFVRLKDVYVHQFNAA
jgi:hypothetical protein